MTQTLSTLGLDAPEASALSEAQLLDIYRTMRSTRAFEDRVHKEFATGDIPGSVHLHAGAEPSAKGVDIKPMMAEIFGKSTGSCRGKGGSMHIADLSKGMLGANGIVGAEHAL